MDAARQLAVARSKLLMDHPFFGTLAAYLKPVENQACPSMSTDGTHLIYNPGYLEKLGTPGLIMAVVAHTVMHCALNHPGRQQGRINMIWRRACDYAVNSILLKAGIGNSGILPCAAGYEGMKAEDIYADLVKKMEKKHGSGDPDEGLPIQAGENISDDPGATGDDHTCWQHVTDGAGLRDKWLQVVARAASAVRARGLMPGGIAELVDILLKPQLDWRKILAGYLQPSFNDYSFIPGDRRYLADNLVLPVLESEFDEVIAVAVDTSGSVSSREITDFLTEFRGLCRSSPLSTVHLFLGDREITDYKVFTAADEFPASLQVTGRGGTSFVPVFRRITELGIVPKVLVYFTDGAGDYPPVEPEYRVIWVVPKGINPARSIQVAWGLKIGLS